MTNIVKSSLALVALSAAAVFPVQAKSFAKAFEKPTIRLNETIKLTLTIGNDDALPLAFGFTDPLPVAIQGVGLFSNSCGGTPSVTPTVLSLPDGQAPPGPGGTCTIVFTVKGIGSQTTPALNKANGSGGLDGFFATDTITVQVPNFSKSFGGVVLPGDFAPTVPRNGTTTLTFNLTNDTPTNLPNFGWTDDLSTSFFTVVSAPATACNGTVSAPAGGSSIVLTGGSLNVGLSCSLVVQVKASQSSPPGPPATPFLNLVSGTGDLLTISRGAFINVKNPTFSKAFAPNVVALNQTSLLTFTIANATGTDLTAVGFTDTMPVGVQVIGAPTVNNCSLLVSGSPNAVNVSGGTVLNNVTCTLTVPVRAVGGTPAVKQNGADGTGDLLGLPATNNLTVNTPVFTKTPGTPGIQIDGTTTFTLFVNNTTGAALTNFGFTDNVPAGLSLVSVTGSTCTGILTPTLGTPGSVVLSGSNLAIGASCSLVLNVKGVALGAQLNTANGTGELLNINPTATVTVTPKPPTFTKSFGAPVIALNQTTTLTFNVGNHTGQALSNIGFGDTLPGGLIYVSTVSNNCTPPGTLGITTGPPSIFTLANASLANNTDCAIVVNVKGIGTGPQDNTAVGAGDLNAINPTASLTVNAPIFTKSFVPPTIVRNTTSVLTLFISNTTGVPLSNISFTDTLPAGVTIGTLVSNDCSVAPVLQAGPPQVALTGASLIIGGSCTIKVNVTGTVVGTPVNTATGGGDLLTINPQATLTVTPPPPTFSKIFSPAQIVLNGTSLLTFTIGNQTGSTKTNLSFSDPMPAGLTVVGTPVSNCGGSFTGLPNAINFSGGTLADLGTCTITANILGGSPGLKTNTATGLNDLATLTANADLAVTGPPEFTKAFSPATINLNAGSTLTFTVKNITGIALNNIGFTDNLQTLGLTSPNITIPNSCNTGTLQVLNNIVTLTGGSLINGATCTIPISVVGATPGVKANVANGTGDLININAPATLTVNPGPILFSKVFGLPVVQLNTPVSLTFTISNNTGANVTNANFTDNLPGGMTVVAFVSSNCLGTPSALTGSTVVSLTGGTIANGASCNLVVTVQSSTPGIKNNVAVGAGDLAGKNADAQLTVLNKIFTKTFGADGTTVGSVLRLTLTITNTTGGPFLNAGFNDPLPAGMFVATPANVSVSGCGAGAVTAVAASASVTLTNAQVGIGGVCTVSVDVLNTTPGPKENFADGTGDIDTETATDTLDVFDAPGDAFQMRYFSNLDIGESFINITNYGGASTVGLPMQNGNLCVNAYTYSPDEQLISCCSCNVTPNGLNSLQVKADLASNTLTPIIPSSVVVKLVATRQSGTCNPAVIVRGDLRAGLAAWGSTLHAAPVSGGTTSGTYNMTETPFSRSLLSDAELTRMTQLCAYLQANGSGYGICKSCKMGGLGASAK